VVPRQVAGLRLPLRALLVAALAAPLGTAALAAVGPDAATPAAEPPSAAPAADQPAEAAEGDCDALWQRTRTLCKEGEGSSGSERVARLERAIAAGEQAVRRCPQSVDAHYWLGASYGRSAEARRGLPALGLTRRLRREMEFVVRHQPGYEDGDAFLALGQLDLQLPWLLGGNRRRGLEWLERGLQQAPDNIEIRVALARGLLDAGRREEASALLAGIRDGSAPGQPSAEERHEAEDLLRRAEAAAPGATPAPGQ
jgi:hypothetical protein